MLESREPILMCVTGAKGVGKTYTTKGTMKSYVRPNSSTGKKGRKILIYDVNKEYTDYKTLRPQDIVKYSQQAKVEVRRIMPLDEDGNELDLNGMVEMLVHIVKSFTGGLLVLEDINKYVVQANHVREVIGLIATNRHRDLDIIVQYQSLRALDPRMWQNTTWIRFHFQTDDVTAYKNKIPNFTMMKIAQEMVNYRYHIKKDQRFYVMVSLLDNFISGDYSVEDFVEGCKRYFVRFPQEIKRRKRNFGNSEELAETAIIKEYMSMYFRPNNL